MRKNNLILLFGAAALVLGLSACSDESKLAPAVIGFSDHDITVSNAAGVYDFDVETNYGIHVEIVGDSSWLDAVVGDVVNEEGNVEKNIAVVSVKYDDNNSFARMVKLVLVSESKEELTDTVFFRQMAGKDPVLKFNDQSAIQVPADAGEEVISIVTNVPGEYLTYDVEYAEDDEEWVSDVVVTTADSQEDSTVKFAYAQATSSNPRSATVTLTFVDGLDVAYSASFTVLQANKDGGFYTTISFAELRNTYATGTPITDYVGISGIVVSNKSQGNVGCPVQKTQTSIDYSPMNKTVYFEAEDASYGIAIYLDSEDDNDFDQFDRFSLMLTGATLTKKGSGNDCPVRYELTGVKKSMIYNKTAGTEAPEKHIASISDITDDDMYTYVSLDNVQLPVRKGPLFPVFGAFCEAAGVQTFTKYPLLVIDKNGDDLYMLTNSKCLYNRDGTRLPYGEGTLHGVITHEHFSRFEWASGLTDTDSDGNVIYNDTTIEDYSETVGNIGKYQLRHQTKDDVWGDMNDDFENGNFKMLTEYRYRLMKCIKDTDLGTNFNVDTLDYPTYGRNGWLTFSYQERYTGSSSKDKTSGGTSTHFNYRYSSFDYLGPVGKVDTYMDGINYGNKNGLGIIIDSTNEPAYSETSRPGRFATNRDGKIEYSCEYSKNEYAGYGSAWVESYKETEDSSCNVPNGARKTSSSGCGTGYVAADNFAGWGSNGGFWDDDKGWGFLFNVSTKDISGASTVCMQLALRAENEGRNTARYWTAKWSDVEPVYGTTVTWHDIGDFTIPDAQQTNYPDLWGCYAAKYINLKIEDAAFLGKDNVYVHICPANNKCGSNTGDYDTSTLTSTGASMYLTYLAIRYR